MKHYDHTKRHLQAIAEGQRTRMSNARANERQPQPTAAEVMAQQIQQRAAAMMMRRETLSGIILNGMLSGMNWQPTGNAFPPEDAAELARDAVTFAEALLVALYPPPPPPPEASNEAGLQPSEATLGPGTLTAADQVQSGDPPAPDSRTVHGEGAGEAQAPPREDVTGSPVPEGSVRADDGQGTQD